MFDLRKTLCDPNLNVPILFDSRNHHHDVRVDIRLGLGQAVFLKWDKSQVTYGEILW